MWVASYCNQRIQPSYSDNEKTNLQVYVDPLSDDQTNSGGQNYAEISDLELDDNDESNSYLQNLKVIHSGSSIVTSNSIHVINLFSDSKPLARISFLKSSQSYLQVFII
jgi:hypothetical protein